MTLKQLIKPKSIAIIGASDRLGSFGNSTAKNALKSKETERVYFVNSKRNEVLGRRCYNSISELPEIVDCVVICTPKTTVIPLIEEAGKLGVKGAIVFASGFSEEDRDGEKLENELIQVANKYGIRVLGPNCFGLFNNIDKIPLWAGDIDFDKNDNRKGIGIIAHSGFVAATIMNNDYFNISYGFSTGNGNAVTIEEFIDFLVDSPDVSVIGIYLEGVKDPANFIDILRKAAEKRKPIVILKAGKSVKGAISAASHTGNLAGSNEVYEGVFEKYGVISVDTLDELMSICQAFSVLKGNFTDKATFGAINLSGGENTICADLSEKHGIDLVDISEETKVEMRKHLPSFATAKNPVDATTALFNNEEDVIGLINTFEQDYDIGNILVGVSMRLEESHVVKMLCKSIAKAKELGVKKPIFAIPSLENTRNKEYRKILEDANVPLMPSSRTAYICIKKIMDYICYDYKKRNLNSAVPSSNCQCVETVTFSEFDSKAEIKNYGVPIPAQVVIKTMEELGVAIRKMNYPIVLKVNSSEILHKSDIGGVKLNITNMDEAEKAYLEIINNLKKYAPNAKFDGILIQEMMPKGTEIIIGINNDIQFGPMLLVGMGGVFVEVFEDAIISPVPLNKYEALEMLKKLKAYKLLTGYRGSEECDIDALVDLIVNISNYAYENKDKIKEMDLNPVFVYPKGKGLCVVDALIINYK